MAGKAHQHGPLSPSRYVAGGRGVAAHACLCCWGWRSGMASGRWCLRQWGSGSPSRWQWRSGSGCCFWLPMHWQRRRASKQGPGCLMGPSTMANIPCPMLLLAFSMGRIRLHPSIIFFQGEGIEMSSRAAAAAFVLIRYISIGFNIWNLPQLPWATAWQEKTQVPDSPNCFRCNRHLLPTPQNASGTHQISTPVQT